MPRNRTAYNITRDSAGGADAAAAAAAALAAAHEAFKEYDPVFAQAALKHAQQLYALATLLPARSYCQQVVDCFEGIKTGGYKWKAYPSTSVYDDLSLAAAWLFAATGVRSYASDSQFFFTQHLARETPNNPTSYISNYENSAHIAALLLDQQLGFPPAQRHMLDFFKGWMTGLSTAKTPVLFVTPKGLHYLAGHPAAGDEPLPNAAHAAMLALLYAHSPRAQARGLTPFVVQNMECFALQQVNYVLGGQRGKARSFVVGLGSSPPTKPQHRQASCASGVLKCTVANSLATEGPNPNVLKGAIVAGPDSSDGFADDRSSEQSRVSVAYNVPFMGTVAGLLQHAVSPANCQKEHGLFQDIFLAATPGT
uniref:cellulase n=1 Tax=Tetradesmus obliquus TaxID=3088 RepID=A0A383VAT7_TETOB|eukprot:jgi/Sobl393_1/7243/SZX77465.1